MDLAPVNTALIAAAVLLIGVIAGGGKQIVEKVVDVWKGSIERKVARDDKRHEIELAMKEQEFELNRQRLLESKANTAALSALVPQIRTMQENSDAAHREILEEVRTLAPVTARKIG